MYLSCGTWLDIAFMAGKLRRHNSDSRTGHLRAEERVVRCLKGAMEMKWVRLPIDSSSCGLTGYADSNFASDSEDWESVIGYCFSLNGAVASWRGRSQITITTSTTESKYITLGHVARQAVWIRRFIKEMKLEVIKDLKLREGVEMSVAMTKSAESQHRTKHIDV